MTAAASGYTMADLDRIAKAAASNNWYNGADYTDLYHAAWSAIVDLYYASETTPTRHDLATVGKGAIRALANQYRQTHGYRDKVGWNGPGSAPKFAAYWTSPVALRAAPFEERLLDTMALAAIWPRLSGRDRDVLTALAVHDDYRAAAAALGMPPGSYRAYISQARRTVLAFWHDWETPPQPKGYNRRRHDVPRQPCGTIAAYRRHKAHGDPVDEACAQVATEYERARRARRAAAAAKEKSSV